MRSFCMSVIGLFFGMLTHAGAADVTKLATSRGAALDMIAEYPSGDGSFPAVIFGPGQGYDMRRPVIEQTSKELLRRGIAVFRFNWAYFSESPQSGKPSKDLAAELEDMSAVLGTARRDSRIAANKIFVAGKSLGSLVAWKVMLGNKDIRGGLFLTPLCGRVSSASTDSTSMADERYPGIAAEKRPLAFIVGELDPLCSAAILYRFVAKAGGPTRVAVIGGAHGFENPALDRPASERVAERNSALAAMLSADFIVEYAAR